MKKILKASLRSFIALSFVSIFAVATAHAQNREDHFISARAGGVNFVSGDVRARREGESDWQRLAVKDDLKGGDAVRTGADGRVEVLLNPGSYFRAGEETEFDLVDASLDNLRLRLARGSALVEATGYDDLGLSIVVATPQTRVRITRAGVYRINVSASGVTEVAVQKGRAFVGEGAETQVRGGQVARVGAGGAEVAKLDKKSRDTLDQWSHERAKELARANDKLANRQTNALLARSRFDGLFPVNYSFSGVWLWNTSARCYTFLPFAGGWGSPYGFDYGSFWLGGDFACGCRPQPANHFPIVHNPQGYTPPPSGNSTWPGTTGAAATPGASSGGTIAPPPPPPTPRGGGVDRGGGDVERPGRHNRDNE